METGARVLLAAFVTIVLVHYLNGGRKDAARWLKYAFSGTHPEPVGWKPTGRSGVSRDSNGKLRVDPTQKRREILPDGTIVETEIGIP